MQSTDEPIEYTIRKRGTTLAFTRANQPQTPWMQWHATQDAATMPPRATSPDLVQ